jgi:hypothetical protein
LIFINIFFKTCLVSSNYLIRNSILYFFDLALKSKRTGDLIILHLIVFIVVLIPFYEISTAL